MLSAPRDSFPAPFQQDSPRTPVGPSRPRLFFDRHLSDASMQTLASINTAILPQYSVESPDAGSDIPPDFEVSISPLPAISTEDHLYSTILNSPCTYSSFSSVSPSPTAENSSPFQTSSNDTSTPSNNLLPPRYSYINLRHSTIITPHTPASRRRQPPHEFEYSFPIRANKPWATLKLFTRNSVPGNLHPSPRQPKTPQIWGGELISGTLQFDLDSPQMIQQISITVKGKIVTSSLEGGSLLFFTHDCMIWDKGSGDPRQPSPEISPRGKFEGKFNGQYYFPFFIPFPVHVDLSKRTAVLPSGVAYPFLSTPSSPTTPLVSPTIPDKGKKKHARSWSFGFSSGSKTSDCSSSSNNGKRRKSSLPQPVGENRGITNIVSPMPQSFVESRVAANVVYELAVHIVHGRFRPESKIKTNISYTPSLFPLPSSFQRQQAYEAGGFLPGPSSDPAGWFQLMPTTIHGKFSEPNGRLLKVDCTLYLARPLSYTRGTVIPCYLTLTSDDTEALDLLSSPNSPNIRLTRSLYHLTPQDSYEGALISDDDKSTAMGMGSTFGPSVMGTQMIPPAARGDSWEGSKLNAVTHEVCNGVWWVPPKDVAQESYTRHLEGEIHLASDLQPSCSCSIFSIEYFVEVLPFSSNRLEPELPPITKGRSMPPLVSQHVEITTLHRTDELVPVAFTEPPQAKIRSLTIGAPIQEELDG